MRWYAVFTQPHAEAKALFNLNRQGFSTYLPLYLKERRHAGRTETIRTPLFPRYLFVAMDVETMRWRVVNSTFGVIQLVMRGELPAPLPDGVIEDLRLREADDGVIRLPQRPLFAKGDPVRVVQGALRDRIGFFECLTDKQRVILLLELLGRQLRVAVPLATVAPAQ